MTEIVIDGKKMTVALQLEVLGTYSSTFPYNCPKTDRIVANAEAFLAKYPSSEYSGTIADVVVYYRGSELGEKDKAWSSVKTALDQIDAIARLAGADSERRGAYPGWKPNLDSPVLELVRRASRELNGTDPKVCAIHAGLECGLLGEKIPGMDMISFGPEIRGAHSPDERLHLESTQRFWKLLVKVLELLAQKA